MQPLTVAQLRATWASLLPGLRRAARRAVPELFDERRPCDA